jgi:hypothetical protein
MSPDGKHRIAGETRQQAAQIVGAKRDAAPSRRKIRPRTMNKDRAPAMFTTRLDIVIDDDHKVVEGVLAP